MNVVDPRLAAVLDARERWYLRKRSTMEAAAETTWIELSLNIPGWPKIDPWIETVHAAGLRAVPRRLGARLRARHHNAAGYFALFESQLDPVEAKRRAIDLEASHPVGRLWDLDCRGPLGVVTRRMLGLPERACLLCPRPHDACIGHGAHDTKALRTRAQHLARHMSQE